VSAQSGAPEPAVARSGRTRLVGAALLLALVLVVALSGAGVERLRSAWFDAHQSLWPRQVATLPVTVVAIDQKSLLEIGQWPWPRNVLARLVRIVHRAEPAAIGINILMPEPDALSPERLLAQAQVEDRTLADALRALPTHDAQLARALAAAPAVLVVAGTTEATRQSLRAAPVMVHGAGSAGQAAPPRPGVPEYPGALTSIDALDSQAAGWGLISAESSRGVIRRMPTVADIDGTLLPSLAVEMLRVAQQAPSLRLTVSGSEVRSLAVGRLTVPTESDGAVRVYFSPHLAQRFVSAVDVLDGKVRESELRGQLVLIGLTGVALQ
jgi:CHASE2 domain-containing sensor protein